MQAAIPHGLRLHAGLVRASMAAATRAAGDEAVPAADLGDPERVPGLTSGYRRHALSPYQGSVLRLPGADPVGVPEQG
jgi:hypothetical protein